MLYVYIHIYTYIYKSRSNPPQIWWYSHSKTNRKEFSVWIFMIISKFMLSFGALVVQRNCTCWKLGQWVYNSIDGRSGGRICQIHGFGWLNQEKSFSYWWALFLYVNVYFLYRFKNIGIILFQIKWYIP